MLSCIQIMKDNDGYMAIKTDYRVFYPGKPSDVFFKFISWFYMNEKKK